MYIIFYLLMVIGRGMCLMIDIAILFVVIRVLCFWRRPRILAGFDVAGRQLVDALTFRVAVWWRNFARGTRVLSALQTLGLTLCVLSLVRLLLALPWVVIRWQTVL